jgi:hypothetical protein
VENCGKSIDIIFNYPNHEIIICKEKVNTLLTISKDNLNDLIIANKWASYFKKN